MKVVHILPSGVVEIIGACDNFHPPKRAGDEIRLAPALQMRADGRLLPFGVEVAAFPMMRFRCVAVRWPRAWHPAPLDPLARAFYGEPYTTEVVVEAVPGGPSPEWLPGWRLAPGWVSSPMGEETRATRAQRKGRADARPV